MLHFVLLVFKNLGRNKVRTALTALAVTVLTIIYVVVTTVTDTVRRIVEEDASQSKLIVTDRWTIPSRVPVRYLDELTKIPGVTDWTTWNWHPGYFSESRTIDKIGVGQATRIENLREMTAGLESIPDSAIEAMMKEKTGCLVGVNIMASTNWRVGQEFTFLSLDPTIPDLRFKVVGVLPQGKLGRGFYFRDDYFREGSGNRDSVDSVILRVRDAETGQKVAAKIQQDFENRQPSLKVETESAGVARMAEKGRVILSIIQMVVAILLIDMVIILSNSISIATRERRTEMAVLKVLGFKPIGIMFMVVGEAMLIGAISGLLGAGLTWSVSELASRGVLPNHASITFLLDFPVNARMLIWGPALGAFVGGIGSVFPAWSARNVKVSDVFAKIA